MLKNLTPYSVLLFVTALACSSESTSWSSKSFHNTTSHYNGYFYAKEEIAKIEATILKSEADDYSKILRLFPAFDSTLAKGYEKEVEEAIKMASIAIQRHPNSKWVDDSYILVGKARLYSLDWGNAVQTLKYVNTKSKDPDTRHEAILVLAHTFIHHKEYANAEAAFDYLAKQKLNKTNQKNFYLEQAYYYQVREDYNKMIFNLSSAAPLLTKKDRPGRVYFIIGQVYQKLGFESEAYNYYRECLSTHPEYEVDFYARLYMAQVAEISRSRSIASARKSFKRLLKDSKNKEFKDRIYYEMGVFEEKQDNIQEAITNYNAAVRLGTNKQIDGMAYLKLGEIYYDTLRDFKLSNAYYDSAVSTLPTNFENYKAIVARQKVLNAFITNLNTITWQDSLLMMAKMDTATLRKHIAAVLESQKKPEVKSKKKKKERIEIEEVSSSLTAPTSLEASNWYFGNASAVALGQTEFSRIWGAIPLEDNWRRSSRASAVSRQPVAVVANKTKEAEKPAAAKKTPLQEALDEVGSQLPRSEEQVQAAHTKIEDAYFALGDIYFFDLHEPDNAVRSYETLLSRYPATEHRAEALYKLYLIFKDSDKEKADKYAKALTSEFPDSHFAKTLVNPDYLKESELAIGKQKEFYKNAYQYYQAENFSEATQLLNQALALEKTSFTPNLELLGVLIAGRTESLSQYQQELDRFIKKYPEHELSAFAKKLLDTSNEFTERKGKEQYTRALEQAHYFILIAEVDENLDNPSAKALSRFNDNNFKELGLKVSNLAMNGSYTITMVGDLPRLSSAIEYYRTFIEKQSTLNELKNHKFNTFIITKDNFDIFYRTKGLDEYLQFFQKNYNTENP